MDDNEARTSKDGEQCYKSTVPVKDTSMSTLVMWNIAKAMEENPNMQLKTALRATQQQLEASSLDVTAVMRQPPAERHLSCALLAWHQLGHDDADSLYQFVESRLKNPVREQSKCFNSTDTLCKRDFISCEKSDSTKSDIPTVGPVLRLPVEPKLVMRLDGCNPPRSNCQRVQKAGVDLQAKIEEACCLETGCMERLAQLDAQTKELRGRLAKLARRESERVELLERAETAWRDLEFGYIRRHRAVIEKEEDMTRQMSKLINERNGYKDVCAKLVQLLKPRGEAAELSRDKLKKIEAQVCERACERLKQSELSAREDALLADIQCKSAQLDRDLQFKEAQARRKQQTLATDLESQRGLTFEAERALRAELGGLKNQIKEVSKELLAEDDAIQKLKTELDQLQKEKCEISEDLNGCQLVCDKAMQKKVDELKSKREQLQKLKDTVLDCRCKVPVDVAVEVKRTPSLAALCLCKPEDRALESCSCTSLRSRLLSDLLSDLFAGLQAELGNAGCKMPCQLLKCLEDRHNWDKGSVVKSNLRNFFAQLLVGELDIAIATSIEKYHAKWVGSSCADISKPIPNYEDGEDQGWEQRALERRAQKLAYKMAEQMFQERAEQIMQKAKDVVERGPPPCDCKPTTPAAVFPVFVEQPKVLKARKTATSTPVSQPAALPVVQPPQSKAPRSNICSTSGNIVPACWQQAIDDVIKMRAQIDDLKKESIRKEDLKIMEEKITSLVKRASSPDPTQDIPTKDNVSDKNEAKRKKTTNLSNVRKANTNNRKIMQSESVDRKTGKISKNQYAVNLCLCGLHRNSSKPPKGNVNSILTTEKGNKSLKSQIQMTSSIKYTKPIQQLLAQNDEKEDDKEQLEKPTCGSVCGCFNKTPSTSSIDKLLETLTKWKCDLNDGLEVTKHDNNKNEYTREEFWDPKKNLTAILPSTKQENIHLPNNYIVKESKDITSENFETKMATTTASEYMGAVNLEKSNENYCKCVMEDSKKRYKLDDSISFVNCIKSCKSVNTNLIDIENKLIETEFKEKNKIKEKLENINNLSKTLSDTKASENKCPKKEKSEISENSKEINSKKLTDKGTENTFNCEKVNRASDAHKFVPNEPRCDCSYEIKFLGVTLANAASNKQLKNMNKMNDNRIKPFQPLTGIEKSKSLMNTMETLNNSDLLKMKTPDTCVSPLQQPDCQCILKLNELKSFFNNTLHKGMGDTKLTQDKMQSTSFISEVISNKQENCVCCVRDSIAEEYNDLEVNTFNLLEQHLKKRLQDLRSNCESSCIQLGEETKIFNIISKKIKETIMQSTKQVICKCSEESQNNGSWHRAYILLQEYLKTKINRIRCKCATPDESQSILPDLTDKICRLIESDFLRLSEICKCKNSERSSFQLPEKEKKNSNTIRPLQLSNSNMQEITMKPVINTAVQILPETKSCEVLTTNCNMMTNVAVQNQDLPDSQNEDKQDFNLKNCILTEKKSALYEVLENATVSLAEDKNANIKDSTEKNISDKISDNAPKSYKGYTIDCSCNNSLGTCVCSKSMVQENNTVVDNLWKTYSNVKAATEKTQYIMKNIYNKKNSIVNEKWDPLIVTNKDKTTDVNQRNFELCDIDTSVYGDEDMILKDSRQNFTGIPIHNGTNTVEEVLSSTTSCRADNTMEWFECGSQSEPDADKKTVHFKDPVLHRAKSEIICEDVSKLTELIFQGCDCSMVPICHVKMLIDNIEHKLANSKCTCDSFSYVVCPVHGNKTSL